MSIVDRVYMYMFLFCVAALVVGKIIVAVMNV